MRQRTVTSFFESEYLEYARYVVSNRAIPHLIDGLKPSQRKIIHIANKIWKPGNTKQMKLFQLAGRVAADAYYHHGNCLDENTIVHSKEYGEISFKDWTEKHPGEILHLLSYDEETKMWNYESTTAPFKGQLSYEEIEIELENGESIKCTPDHMVLLTNGNWIEAQYLSQKHEIKSI